MERTAAIYAVLLQNASGQQAERAVRADTQEGACTAALRDMNSWKAINAMPVAAVMVERKKTCTCRTPIETATIRRHVETMTTEQAAQPGRIIRISTPTDLIKESNVPSGTLGAALRRAAGRITEHKQRN